jgi:hypothetical protein
MTVLALTGVAAGVVGGLLLRRSERHNTDPGHLGAVATLGALLVSYAVVAALVLCGLVGGAFE